MRKSDLLSFSLVAMGLVMVTGSFMGTSFGTVSAPTEFGADGGPEADGDPDNSAFGLPSIFQEDEPTTDPAITNTEPGGDPDTENDTLPERYLVRSVPWLTPDYSKQDGALGWSPDLFKVPPALKERVAFWKEIYARYTTDEGVLHDIDDLSIVYDALEFGSIMRDPKTSLRSKARARSKQVDKRRAEILKGLEKISKLKSERDLGENGSELRKLYALFTPKYGKNFETTRARIKEAAKKKKIRFQLGQRDKFILGVYYSGRYLRQMEKHFRAEKMPVELTRLPFVESSFNILARSRVGASGVWQFMPRTARPKMMVSREVDERNDPLTATMAAARLLRSNYEQLDTWPLALTAYNHGAAGLAKAVKKTGTRDLAVIIDKYESRRFGFASQNFYACFLAALEVERNARSLLGEVKWSLEFAGEEIDIERDHKNTLTWKSVIDFYDGEAVLAELQNPHFTKKFRKSTSKVPRGTFVRVPKSRGELVREFLTGKIDEATMKRRLAVTPIPRNISPSTKDSDAQTTMGSISEAAEAVLPFLKSEEPKEKKEN